MRPTGLLSRLVLLAGACTASAQSTDQVLLVNGRTYTLPASTPVIIDDQPGVLADLVGQPAGMQLRWLPASASPRGNVPLLVFSYTLIGPVTRIDPLEVLGQPVTITGETELEGFQSAADLEPGAPMIVAGLVDPNGSLYATLAVRRGAQGNKYLLTGYVQQVADVEPRLRVGEQWIDTTGVVFDDCPDVAPAPGDYLELRADSIASFQPGDPIDTVTQARCTSPVPVGTPGAQGLLEGIVGAAVEGESFQLGALTVAYDETTVFEYGGPDDLEPGVDVSAEGVFLDATTFTAASVEFVRPVVRMEVPMVPADVSPGVAIRPFGVDILHSAQVRDDDGILANGLFAPSQVQVRGWIDRNGQAFATRVRERGDPDASDVALRGPVAAFARPSVTVQGLTIDSTGALFFDADDLPIDADTFFSDLRINHMVDVSGASWDATTRTLTGGAIILLGYEHTQPVPGDPGTVVSGTVRSYGAADAIFTGSFDILPP